MTAHFYTVISSLMKHTTPSLDIVIVTSTHVKRFHIGRQYQACLDHPGAMVHVELFRFCSVCESEMLTLMMCVIEDVDIS